MNAEPKESRVSRRPPNTPFRQGKMKANQLLLTPKGVIFCFLLLGIIFVPVGAAMLFLSNSVVEYTLRYDDICPESTVCNIVINLPKMEPPVYMYYRLSNFYQNYRRYTQSRDPDQLAGRHVSNSYSSLNSDCAPYTSNGNSQDPNNFYVPCGLMARSMFNDSFSLWDSTNTPVPLKKEGIAWTSDKKLFKNPALSTPGIRTIADFEDEDFVVWMKPAPLPDFKKIHRIISTSLEGNYTLQVKSVFPTKVLNSKKYVVLSTTTAIGGKNSFLGWAYIVMGAVLIIQGILFGIQQKLCPRKMGDQNFLRDSVVLRRG